jgi:quercetin dioxygenase-like cupin family protein
MTTTTHQIPAASPVVIEPGGGDLIHMGALAVFFKVVSAQVGGACELHEQPIPPGTLVAPHTHDRQDQVSYVLDGTLGFRVGAADVSVPAGGAIFRPRGIPHAVWNAGPEPARMLELSTPGREIESFFREFDQLSQAGQVSAAAVAELARPYGISYHLDLIPLLEARYGISAGSGWWAR